MEHADFANRIRPKSPWTPKPTACATVINPCRTSLSSLPKLVLLVFQQNLEGVCQVSNCQQQLA